MYRCMHIMWEVSQNERSFRSVQAKLKYFMFAQHMGIFFQNKRSFFFEGGAKNRTKGWGIKDVKK